MPENKPNKPAITIISTGNELISGDILDTNSAFIAKELTLLGLPVQQKLTVGDKLEHLVKAVESLSKAMDLIIFTGGLGGTVDDLTCETVSKVSGVPLLEQSRAISHIKKILNIPNRDLKAAYLKQATLPQGVYLFDNSVGLALGFCLKINRAQCYFLPGVPREMESMLIKEILPHIKGQYQTIKKETLLRFHLFGLGESQVQKILLDQIRPEIMKNINLGFRATSPFVELKLELKDNTKAEFIKELEKQVQDLLGQYCFSRDKNLAEEFVKLLSSRPKTLSVAESCTGGMISSLVTSVPGSSAVFKAGLVTYGNKAKNHFLKVPAELLQLYGAVSPETAQKMLLGVLNETGTDYALAVTGIAGPDGGSPQKPLGTVYIALGDKKTFYVRHLCIPRERKTFQRFTSFTALDLLRRFIRGLPLNCPYYFDDITKDL